jgi:hypothetical protein
VTRFPGATPGCRLRFREVGVIWSIDFKPFQAGGFRDGAGPMALMKRKFGIETLELIDGKLPRRAFGLVLDRAELHRQEVRDNWLRGEEHDALSPIAPLE